MTSTWWSHHCDSIMILQCYQPVSFRQVSAPQHAHVLPLVAASEAVQAKTHKSCKVTVLKHSAVHTVFLHYVKVCSDTVSVQHSTTHRVCWSVYACSTIPMFNTHEHILCGKKLHAVCSTLSHWQCLRMLRHSVSNTAQHYECCCSVLQWKHTSVFDQFSTLLPKIETWVHTWKVTMCSCSISFTLRCTNLQYKTEPDSSSVMCCACSCKGSE